jgi:hypothetical protein
MAIQTRVTAVALALALLGMAGAQAQTPPGAESQPPAAQPAPQHYSPAQLDALLAPIALYPDPLIAQILMASTYPLEVVEADRWRIDPKNSALTGNDLATAVEQQPWDPSVKSLIQFPRILQMMDGDLDWLERLGDAFLADQAAVMNSVQHLRHLARQAGKLNSSPQLVVTDQGGDISLEPPNPDAVSVPFYDPSLVYGQWPYPDFPPFYFPDFFDGVFIGDLGYGWWNVPIFASFWGWGRCDWGHHRIDIDRTRFASLNHHQLPSGSVWQHDPLHRRGVAYRDPVVRSRFAGNAGPLNLRPSGAVPQFRLAPNFDRQQDLRAPRQIQVSRPPVPPQVSRPSAPAYRAPAPAEGRPAQAPVYRPPVTPHVQATFFRSFSRGPYMQSQPARWFSNRVSMPAFQSRGFAPTPPRSGGNGRR